MSTQTSSPGLVRAQVDSSSQFNGTEAAAKDGAWEVQGNAYFAEGTTDNLVFRGSTAGGTGPFAAANQWGFTLPVDAIIDTFEILVRCKADGICSAPQVTVAEGSTPRGANRTISVVSSSLTDFTLSWGGAEAAAIQSFLSSSEINGSTLTAMVRFQKDQVAPCTVYLDRLSMRLRYHTPSNPSVFDTGLKTAGFIQYGYIPNEQDLYNPADMLTATGDSTQIFQNPNITSGIIEVRNITGTVPSTVRNSDAVEIQIVSSASSLSGRQFSHLGFVNIELWRDGVKVGDLPEQFLTAFSQTTYTLTSQVALVPNESFNFTVKFRIATGPSPPIVAYIHNVRINIPYHSDSGSTFWNNTNEPARLANSDNIGMSHVSIANNTSTAALHVLDFQTLNIPSPAMINGVQFEVDADIGSQNNVKDSIVRIMFGDHRLGPNKAQNVNVSGSVQIYGGPTDTWDLNYAALNFNDSGFGISLQYLNASGSNISPAVDWVRVTVYYTSIQLDGSLTQGSSVATAHLIRKIGFKATSTLSTGISAAGAHITMRPGLAGTVFQPHVIIIPHLLGGITLLDTPWLTPQWITAGGNFITPNPGGAGVEDDYAAVFSPTSAGQYGVVGSQFGFTLPNLASVEYFTVRVKVRCTAPPAAGMSLNVFIGLASDNFFGVFIDIGTRTFFNNTSYVYLDRVYLNNDPLDLIEPSVFNNPNWAVHVIFKNDGNPACNVEVDSIQVKVRYHLASPLDISVHLNQQVRFERVVSLIPLALNTIKASGTRTDALDQGQPWSNLANIQFDSAAVTTDTVTGTYALSGSPLTGVQKTNTLSLTNFAHTKPTSIATLEQIRVRWTVAKEGTGNAVDDLLCLVKGGTALTSINKADTTSNYSTIKDGKNAIFSKTELATLGITAADVITGNFGFAYRGRAVTGATSVKVRLLGVGLEVFWNVVSATLNPVITLQGRVSRPVPLGLGVINVGTLPPPPVLRRVTPITSSTNVPVQVRGLLGLPHRFTSTVSMSAGTSSPILKIGIPRALQAALTQPVNLLSPMFSRGPALRSSLFMGLNMVNTDSLLIISIANTSDMSLRHYNLLPRSWFGESHDWLTAVLQGPGAASQFVYGLLREASFQLRIKTATGGWLDLWANDFLGTKLTRRERELDPQYRTRIVKEIFRERDTRHGMEQYLHDLIGSDDFEIVELRRPLDTGAYNYGYNLGYGVAGHYGSQHRPYQAFINVNLPPALGIPYIGGYSTPVWGYGEPGRGAWTSEDMYLPGVRPEDVYAGISSIKPAGTLVWVSVS